MRQGFRSTHRSCPPTIQDREILERHASDLLPMVRDPPANSEVSAANDDLSLEGEQDRLVAINCMHSVCKLCSTHGSHSRALSMLSILILFLGHVCLLTAKPSADRPKVKAMTGHQNINLGIGGRNCAPSGNCFMRARVREKTFQEELPFLPPS